MKNIITIITLIPILIVYVSYKIIEKVQFDSLIEKIEVPEISSDEEIVSRDIHDMIINPFDRIVRKVEGKECMCDGDKCPREKHECLEWVKVYYMGKLRSGTFYELFPIPHSKYYQQKVKYHFSFLENGKILRIQHPKGYQYFDRDENMYKVCELHDSIRRGMYFRKCWEKNMVGKWIYKEEVLVD